MGKSSDFNSLLSNLDPDQNFYPPQLKTKQQRVFVEKEGTKNLSPISDEVVEKLDYQLIVESMAAGVFLYDLESDRVISANQAACTMHGYKREEFIGLSPTSFIHPEGILKFKEIQELLHDGESYSSISTNLSRDGKPFVVEMIFRAFPIQNRTYILAIMHLIDSYLQSVEKNQLEMQSRLAEQTRLLDFAQVVSGSLEMDVSAVMNRSADLLPFDQAVLFRLHDEKLTPVGYCDRLNRDGNSIHSYTLKSPDQFESMWSGLSSLRFNPSIVPGSGSTAIADLERCELPQQLPGMPDQLWVPLRKKERILGCLGFGHQDMDFFDPHHIELAERISGLLSNAVSNAEMFSQAQASAALEERRILARNLHDAVNQSLFSAGLIAEVLPHVWDKDQNEGRRSLEDLRKLTRGAQAEIRMMLVDLRPSALIDVEIRDLLHLLAHAFAGRTNILIEEHIEKDITLPAKIQTAYYHFCQEALNNIVKHAKATRVEISFEKKDQSYNLCIKDNGIGFDRRRKGIKRDRKLLDREWENANLGFNPKYIPPGHYGLRMMDELAVSVGAELRIDTRPGQGTSISIHWKNASMKEGITE
jgi:PAS domain S-box-containing protein